MAKIGDFGFAVQLPVQVGTTQVVTAVGSAVLAVTRGYLAPEFTEGKHGVKSDVYSYGVVSYFTNQVSSGPQLTKLAG